MFHPCHRRSRLVLTENSRPCSSAGRVVFAVVIVATSSGHAQPPQRLACRETTVTGRVERGQAFEAPLGNDLVFRLDPEMQSANPPGWTIQITPASDPEVDYLMVATPPYRFSNPRYVSTAYGITADAALAWTPREFAFVAGARDFEGARQALGVLLWSGNHTQVEIAEAQAVLDRLPTYPGSLRLEAGATSAPDAAGSDAAIGWIEFTAELCVPDRPVR